MPIEKSLERIADALEAIVQSQGIVAGTVEPQPVKKASKKKAASQVVGKVEKQDGDASEATIEGVREALKQVRAEVSQAKMKSILKKFGASTLKQMDKRHYANAIKAAEAMLE